jgi:hypothetical protein
MGLLAPWYLAGLLALGLPVWLHLLKRRRVASGPLPNYAVESVTAPARVFEAGARVQATVGRLRRTGGNRTRLTCL